MTDDFGSNDVAMRLREDSFVTGFPPGWKFVKVWETSTRQDAELLVHAFRAICRDHLPGGSAGECELVSLPLPTIVRLMELIIGKAAASKRILLAHVQSREISVPAMTSVASPDPHASFSLTWDSPSDSDARPLRANLHYDDYGRSRCELFDSFRYIVKQQFLLHSISVLSPERDNYRFLVLWEELGDSIRLDKGEILCDLEKCLSLKDATKVAASAAAEALAACEANSAIQTKAALKAEAQAKIDAATENMRQQFLSIQSNLEKTANELHCLRLRAAAVVRPAEASDPSIRSYCSATVDSNSADQIDELLSRSSAPAANSDSDLSAILE